MSEVNHNFLRYIKEKPKLYEKSSSAFWDDENISKYMLEAHLNQEEDGAKMCIRDSSSISSFIRSFKKIVGMTPGKYREIYGKKEIKYGKD